MGEKTVNLLWTGGWDSTFRLLDLLFVRSNPVQPYYIIDPDRRSLSMEIETMGRIRRKLDDLLPDSVELLRPVIMFHIDDIPPDHEISEKLKRLRSMNHIGMQYEWLARFARQFGPANLEIGIEKGPASLGVNWFLQGHLHFEEESSGNGTWVLNDSERATDLSLFQYFSFPLFGITKSRMREVAFDKGFLEIMNMTWFCLSPIFGKPCGMCHPCSIVMNVGLKDRIAMMARFRYHLKKMIRSIFPQG